MAYLGLEIAVPVSDALFVKTLQACDVRVINEALIGVGAYRKSHAHLARDMLSHGLSVSEPG